MDRLIGGTHHDPHSVLGSHPAGDGTVIRVLRPNADAVEVVFGSGADTQTFALQRVHEAGLFSALVPHESADYRLAVHYGAYTEQADDPYRWLPTLGEVDLHLIGEGRHERLWDVLGAHPRVYDTPGGKVAGTSFAVWAPTARGVRVCGDFDGWNGVGQPMRSLGSSGVWEVFLPGVGVGARYKFRVFGADGRWYEKADPMAFSAEVPPATASIVTSSSYTWGDEAWLERRAHANPVAEPMSVYEVHLGSWRPGLNYRGLATELVSYLNRTGFTHVELLPVAEHPFGGSWGYQVSSYYAPTARFGTPDDFRHLVDTLHQAGYGVIVDWVPAHFPKDEWALARFDGTPLYEHPDPRRGEQLDWGTYVFDFGRKEVRNFLVANALYWLDEFHIDGLRVDAVASMLYLDYSREDGQWEPNIYGGRENLEAVSFLQEMNATVYREHPGVVTIAEESTSWPGVTRPTHLGGLGFGFKWNMGWMHDTLHYAGRDPIHRAYHHNEMTFSMVYAYTENFVLPISHDEVVHGKGSLWTRMPGDDWNKAANLRALLAYMWAHPGKQLLFMGCEIGQHREWSESRSLDWGLLENPLHSGIQDLVGDLNRTYRAQPALYSQDSSPDGFAWIDANDAGGNVFSFLRWGSDGSVLACIANFAGHPHENYRVGLPFAGQWSELLNTDSSSYGGSGVGNLGAVVATEEPWHGRPASATLRVPPTGVLWLRGEPAPVVEPPPSTAASASEPAAASSTAVSSGPAAPAQRDLTELPSNSVAPPPNGVAPSSSALASPSNSVAPSSALVAASSDSVTPSSGPAPASLDPAAASSEAAQPPGLAE
ncbi:MAG TPA: 1,4-alpha-glucan branching protein GlgB [Pseudonocardia sp.]|nr:1,4-alpha-glucan branching protein GlgB [Pseudonocardia sp.]